ncbi:cytochrome c oxidase accessory protein CcoG [Noviherbaspirillum sp. UKPF54]|uniref:cytochrome c oxidase accessory protein CcoG n=1 Tax=Noviherbaspirillum sp. UKPF54 TaxID=2601898 RepID=UPI0011B0F48B|nr:cytochrome c oxidase accessory protein CcoG [Noviherbaspirillum sp. UKPF54]QDZ27982.1 cytochrome c oxidase accessory protein CcoG [Noviherbaspirillum sp. UKPF54]
MSDAAPKVSVIKMYAAREEIYPREVKGWYANWRWICVWLTQLVFYGFPWLSWNGRQAVLFDLGARKFYIFGVVLWPQDFIYLALLLIICAYALFLFTAVAGRLWCGFSCPQTVYTEIFMWVERKIEGTRSARMRLDKQPWTAEKVAKKSAKHLIWGAIALWTGFTFVGYFTPMHELLGEVKTLGLGPWEWFWVLFYGFATYGNAGWMREQVCKYMCPYARFQSSMFDKDTLTVTYDKERGDPRGARSKSAAKSNLGDCIDCSMCVQVCPTGIDIRNGLQYDCIGCAACVDACDSVMDKVGSPRGLIRYTTENALKNHFTPQQIRQRTMRPRVLIYTGILVLIVAGFLGSLLTRTPLKLDVIRDRGAMGREVEDGMIENVYRLQIMNTDEFPHKYKIKVSGIETIALAGAEEVALPATGSRAVPVRVRIAHGKGQPGSNKIMFEVESTDGSDVEVKEKAVFFVPR